LSSNGTPQHLGLLVKYPGQSEAYIVTEHGYLMGSPLWVIPALALQPGRYEVDLMFRASGNKTGQVTLGVWNDGINGTIGCEVAPKGTI